MQLRQTVKDRMTSSDIDTVAVSGTSRAKPCMVYRATHHIHADWLDCPDPDRQTIGQFIGVAVAVAGTLCPSTPGHYCVGLWFGVLDNCLVAFGSKY